MDLADISYPEPKTGTGIEAAILNRLRSNGQKLLLAYLDQNTENHSTYIGRDAAKLLFPEYLDDRTQNNRDCDLAASALADAARRTVLRQQPDEARNRVTILTGCPASGKTINADGEQATAVEMVHETIFTSYERAKVLITEAAAARRTPSVHLFYTDDPRINVRRMLERAQKIGRTVPVSYMARAYIEVPQIVSRLAKEFVDTLTIRVTNNSETRDRAVTHDSTNRALYHTQRYNLNSCLEAMHEELDNARNRNDFSAAILGEAAL